MRSPRARLVLAGALALIAPLLAVIGDPAGARPRERTTVWLCHPDRDDACDTDLTTTVIDAEGTVVDVTRDHRAGRSRVDCFYVYPTVSDQPSPQADLSIDPELESIAVYQAARFSSTCRVFAPVYRQLTLRNITAPGGTTPEMRETAYQDVRTAWLEYLRHDNRGRGVVFIGHSQGSSHLRRLIAEEVDPNAKVRRKLVSALLLGSSVTVPEGRDVGGDFQHIPACRSADQIGCVISFATFGGPVPAESRFGRTAAPGREVLCTNPAALGGGTAPVDTVEPTEPFAPGTTIAAAIALLGRPPITASTAWVEYRDAYDATCVSENGANVLRVEPQGSAPRLNPVPDPTWGLHLVDVSIALGDLLDVVEQQSHRWAHGRGHGRGHRHHGHGGPLGGGPGRG